MHSTSSLGVSEIQLEGVHLFFFFQAEDGIRDRADRQPGPSCSEHSTILDSYSTPATLEGKAWNWQRTLRLPYSSTGLGYADRFGWKGEWSRFHRENLTVISAVVHGTVNCRLGLRNRVALSVTDGFWRRA